MEKDELHREEKEVTGKDKCKKPCPDAVPEYPSALPSCPQHYSSADP